MELKEIKSIIDLMARNGLTEFELEKDNVKIRIKRGPDGQAHILPLTHRENGGMVQLPAAIPVPAASSSPETVSAIAAKDFKEIKSPMVGTLYRSPSPETAPYVEIGQAVTEDTVVCIIEAMKVMNEIKAEMRGVITEILVENAKSVEFGKPLFRLKPN